MRSFLWSSLSDWPATRQTFSKAGKTTTIETELLISTTSALYNLEWEKRNPSNHTDFLWASPFSISNRLRSKRNSNVMTCEEVCVCVCLLWFETRKFRKNSFPSPASVPKHSISIPGYPQGDYFRHFSSLYSPLIQKWTAFRLNYRILMGPGV
jgi:hypothetical protein